MNPFYEEIYRRIQSHVQRSLNEHGAKHSGSEIGSFIRFECEKLANDMIDYLRGEDY